MVANTDRIHPTEPATLHPCCRTRLPVDSGPQGLGTLADSRCMASRTLSSLRQIDSHAGFTLLELLVVLVILGVMAALAIPQYASYRLRAFNAQAQSDLRSAVNAQEAFFEKYEAYGDCMNAGCEVALRGYRRSEGVSIACTPRESDQLYQCSTIHARGNRTFYYDSENSVFWES